MGSRTTWESPLVISVRKFLGLVNRDENTHLLVILLCELASRTEEKGERELFSYCGYYVYHSCHRDLRSTMGVTPQTQRVPQVNPPPFRLLLFGCFYYNHEKSN